MDLTSIGQALKKGFSKLVVLLFLLTVSSCGGGGGDSGESGSGGTGGSGGTNASPTVTVSSSGFVNSGATFSINASASDSDGSIASYAWSQTSGTSVSIENANSSTLSFVAPTVSSDTTLDFSITVTDNDGATASANISVLVSLTGTAPPGTNTPPTISMPLTGEVSSGGQFSLTATASDNDGSIVSYFWSQTTGDLVNIDSLTTNSLSFTAPTVTSDKTLVFKLTVTDNEGLTTSLSITVTVLANTGVTVLQGKILSLTLGTPIEGAIVNSGGQSTITDNNGFYQLNNLPYSARTLIEVTHNGYAKQFKLVNISAAESNVKLTIKLTPTSLNDTFSQAISRTLDDPNSPASIEITENTLVDSNGNVFAGSINGKLTFLNPSQISDVMPGDYLTNGGTTPIESFGGIAARFADEFDASNTFKLKNGSTAVIRIPVRSKNDLITDEIAPATKNLYYFNETNGTWVQEGIASYVHAGSNSYYEGKISRLGIWSTNDVYSSINISGCVVDLNNNPLSGISVITDGDNYSGMTASRTDSSGNFTIKAKANSEVLLWASNAGARSNTVLLSTTSSNGSLNDCLAIADIAITITVTWGLGLNDVDAHLYGPSYHVTYDNRGSLTSSPWASLDVDDVNTLGPEVVSIVALPETGNYSFKVHNYSRSVNGLSEQGLTIAEAKVEFNFQGDVVLFTPPPGEVTKNAWHVFDLEVISPGVFSLKRIDTWSKDL